MGSSEYVQNLGIKTKIESTFSNKVKKKFTSTVYKDIVYDKGKKCE